MRKLLNVLYVTTPDAYVTRDGRNVVVRVEQEERARVPIHILESIVCFNYTGVSPPLMALCAESGVSLSFITESGRFLARVVGPTTGNVLLRRQQYRLADNENQCAPVVSSIVSAKIANCRSVLRRAVRDHSDAVNQDRLNQAIDELSECLRSAHEARDIDLLRGFEGRGARVYFGVFDELVLEDKSGFAFEGRNRRPPKDNMNALLSFLYTLLRHDVQSALETVGLDPYVGFLHRDRPGRPSLALDLMEDLRPYLADRIALSLVNRRQVTARGFRKSENGAVVMTSDTRNTVLAAWQKRKQETIVHPFLQEKIQIGLIPYVQALLLARHIRGDLDGFPPFIWR